MLFHVVNRAIFSRLFIFVSSTVQHPVLQPGPVHELRGPAHQVRGRVPGLVGVRDPEERRRPQEARHRQAWLRRRRDQRLHVRCHACYVREAGQGQGLERRPHVLRGEPSFPLPCLCSFLECVSRLLNFALLRTVPRSQRGLPQDRQGLRLPLSVQLSSSEAAETSLTR